MTPNVSTAQHPGTGAGQHSNDVFVWFHDRKTALEADIAALQAAMQATAEHAVEPNHPAPAALPHQQWEVVAHRISEIHNGLAHTDVPDNVRATLDSIGTHATQMSQVSTGHLYEVGAQIQWLSQMQEVVHGLALDRNDLQDYNGYTSGQAEYLQSLLTRIEDAKTNHYWVHRELFEVWLTVKYGSLAGLEHEHMDQQPLAVAAGVSEHDVSSNLYGIVGHLDAIHEYLTSPHGVQLDQTAVAALLGNVQWVREQMIASETAPARQFLEPEFFAACAGAFAEMEALGHSVAGPPNGHH